MAAKESKTGIRASGSSPQGSSRPKTKGTAAGAALAGPVSSPGRERPADETPDRAAAARIAILFVVVVAALIAWGFLG